MNAVLASGASQLGLTTTILPQIHQLQTTLPYLPRHARLHQKLLEQKKLDQLPQFDEMDGARTTHKPRRRTKRQQRKNVRGYLHVKSGGGYNLRIHRNGAIDGEPISNTPSVWCLLKIVMAALAKGIPTSRDTDKEKVYIQGSHSKFYVCMNSSGIPYARATRNDDCYFYEDKEGGHRYYYISAAHGVHSNEDRGKMRNKGRWKKEWLLGLNSDGKPRPGYRTSRSQKFGAFLIYPEARPKPENSSPFGNVLINVHTHAPHSSVTPTRRHRHGDGRRGRDCRSRPTRKQRRRCRRRRERRKNRRKHQSSVTPTTDRTSLPPLISTETQTIDLKPTTTPLAVSTMAETTTIITTIEQTISTPVKPTTVPSNVVRSTTISPRERDAETTTRSSEPPRFDDMIQGLSHFNEKVHDYSFEQISRRRAQLEEILAQIRQSSRVIRTKRSTQNSQVTRTRGGDQESLEAPFRHAGRHAIPKWDNSMVLRRPHVRDLLERVLQTTPSERMVQSHSER